MNDSKKKLEQTEVTQLFSKMPFDFDIFTESGKKHKEFNKFKQVTEREIKERIKHEILDETEVPKELTE